MYSRGAESVSESRKRQSKRDDAIRKRIENDLSKKKKSGSLTSRHNKPVPGTVLALKPSDPIICKSGLTGYEVAQLMSAKRENCILVINDIGELVGIFTAKDLAFRIVGSGLNAAQITVDQIMTPSPLCAQSSSPASQALDLMVEKGFRHLPVLDDENHIVGVLDITKCYAQQMEKLERMHSSSKKLYEALNSVHSEIGHDQHPSHIFQYFEDLKSKMNSPTLQSVLSDRTTPVYISEKSTVYEATVLMKQNKTTAVLVKDSDDEVKGIFTSKDVVLRVIAAGLDPKKCSIIRVMTPHPDVANLTLPIQDALRQMFDGHYLNLPVVGQDNDIVGIVDVLKLTYATLNQIKQVKTSESSTDVTNVNSHEIEEGPAWNKFWTGLQEDSDSMHSDSFTGSTPDITPSEFQAFNIDIKPSDSVSHVDVKPSNSKFLKTAESLFTFKFQSPAIEGRVHRISLNPSDGVEKLRQLVDSKLVPKDFEKLKTGDCTQDETYAISYVDDEGDIVSITSDHDLVECVQITRKLGFDKADLYLHNPHEPAPIERIRTTKKSKELIPGIANEILIPGAIAVLASAAVIGFVMRK